MLSIVSKKQAGCNNGQNTSKKLNCLFVKKIKVVFFHFRGLHTVRNPIMSSRIRNFEILFFMLKNYRLFVPKIFIVNCEIYCDEIGFNMQNEF